MRPRHPGEHAAINPGKPAIVMGLGETVSFAERGNLAAAQR